MDRDDCPAATAENSKKNDMNRDSIIFNSSKVVGCEKCICESDTSEGIMEQSNHQKGEQKWSIPYPVTCTDPPNMDATKKETSFGLRYRPVPVRTVLWE